jgi:transcriptional regulator with XRE-family HTH domain
MEGAMLDLTQLSPGRRLRVCRVAAGLRGWELAARAGLAPGRLSELETGRRPGTADEWQRLHQILDRASALDEPADARDADYRDADG